LGLSHLSGIPAGEAVAALGQYRDALAEWRAYARERWQSLQPLRFLIEAMFEQSLTMIEAELSWVKGFVERMEDQDVQA
jgi:hypothetical protein